MPSLPSGIRFLGMPSGWSAHPGAGPPVSPAFRAAPLTDTGVFCVESVYPGHSGLCAARLSYALHGL